MGAGVPGSIDVTPGMHALVADPSLKNKSLLFKGSTQGKVLQILIR